MSSLLLYLTAGVPNLQDLSLMTWGETDVIITENNNINKVHNKCNVLESSPNHPNPQSVEKLSSMKPVPGAKRVWGCCLTLLFLYYSFAPFCSFEKTRIHTFKIEMQSKRIFAWEYPSEGDLWQYRADIPRLFLKIAFLY